MSFRITFCKEKKQTKLLLKRKIFVLRRGYTEISLSDYFMKHSLMYISLHLI